MQSLKALYHALIDILIEYHDFQFKSNTCNKENILETKWDTIEQGLKKIIEKINKKYNGRESFLNYILFIIKTLHPLVHNPRLMNEEEEKQIRKILHIFFITCKTLLNYQKSESIAVKYTQDVILMNGFKQCKTAEILLKHIHIASSMQLQPFTLDKVNENILKEYVSHLIKDSQSPLKNNMLFIKISRLEEKNKFLSEQLHVMEKNSEKLSQNNQVNFENFEMKINQLEKTCQNLTNENLQYQSEQLVLKENLIKNENLQLLLTHENKQLHEKILMLEKELMDLNEKSKTDQQKISKTNLKLENAEKQLIESTETLSLLKNALNESEHEIMSLKQSNSKYFSKNNQYYLFNKKLYQDNIVYHSIFTPDTEKN